MSRKLPPKLIRTLNMGIYPGHVMFCHRFAYDEIVDFLREEKCEDWLFGLEGDKDMVDSGNYFGLGRTINNEASGEKKHLYYIIIKEPFRFTDYEYCKLAHEVLHICQFHLPKILDRKREFESEAYLHTHLMSQCLKELRGS